MAFAKVRDILKMADEGKTSVIAFNCSNYDMAYSAIYGAEKVNKPVICMLYPEHQYQENVINLKSFAAMVRSLAEEVSVPVGLHLDHSSDYEYIVNAMSCGFTSVMYDGSMLSLEENIYNSRKVVETAHILGVDVEAELGHVGMANVDDQDLLDLYTKPEVAARFIQESGVDSLAVAIGSAHGDYLATPKLDLERLDEINAATAVPLVLHGGSGIPDDQLNEAFRRGINKFNVGTEFFKLWKTSTAKHTADPSLIPVEVPARVQADLIEYIVKKLELVKL